MASNFHVPKDTFFPFLDWDPDEGTMRCDPAGLWALIRSNPEVIPWDDLTVERLLAVWWTELTPSNPTLLSVPDRLQ